MGQDPDAIRQEIEQTRSQMGDTIDALGYKTDVKSRAKDSVSEKTDAVKDKVGSVMGRASDATPSGGDVKRAASTAQENPLGLAIGAVAVGFAAGMVIPTRKGEAANSVPARAAVGFGAGNLIPNTNVKDRKIGPGADELKDRAKETGQEALQHGKQVA